MDLIVSLGYIGQEIHYLDNEKVAFVTGRGLCIYDVNKGPRDIIWQNIRKIAVNHVLKVYVFISYDPNEKIGLFSISDQSNLQNTKNPSSAELINVSFSRSGNRMYALSGSIDHRVLIWNVSTDHMKLIISYSLSSVSRYFIPNPCDENYFVVFGDDGLSFGLVSEIFGEYSCRVHSIVLDGESIPSEDLDDSDQIKNKILFIVWLTGNRFLAGTSQGFLFQISCDNINSENIANFNRACQNYLGRFYADNYNGNGPGEYFIPTCAVVTSTHLIVGTEEGFLYWYQINDTNTKDTSNLINCKKVLQKSSTRDQPISYLSIDPSYQTIVIGTYAGEIFKVSSDIQEAFDAGQGLVDETEVEATKLAVETAVETVDLETVGNESKFGISLCSKSFSIGIEKLNGRIKGSLSLFITGSHLGILTFWKQPVQSVDALTIGGGIRKSNPRPMTAIANVIIGQSKSKNPALSGRNPSISCLDFIPWIEKPNAQFICVGSDDGWLEIWIVEALENEEDEVREADFKLVDDDDGGSFVRLDVKKVFETRLYNSSLTSLVPAIFSFEDKMYFNICTGSAQDPRIFMVTIIQNDSVVLKTANYFLSVDPNYSVKALYFSEERLQAWTSSGSVYYFDIQSSNDVVDPVVRQSGLSSIESVSQFKRLRAYLVLDATNKMLYIPTRSSVLSEIAESETIDIDGIQKFPHDDIVTCMAHSPNGRYFATGCIDGAIYVWKVEHEGSLLFLANQMLIHSSSVISLTFSACSSYLFSNGSDGSCFLFTVDKEVTKGVIRSSVNLSKISSGGAATGKAISAKISESSMTWLQYRDAEKIREMQSQYKFKTMGISAAVNEISSRLQLLLDQNAERNDLERMDDVEFVIDQQREKELVQSNISKTEVVKAQYKRKNLWHELRAARVRSKCWDHLETTSTTLLPFLSAAINANLYVSSFSVERQTSEWIDLASKVMRLRAIEIRTMRGSSALGLVKKIRGTSFYRSAWSTSLSGCPSNLSWISSDGLRWPVNDQIENLLGGGEKASSSVEGKDKVAASSPEEDEEANYLDEEGEFDEMNVLNLLYPPQAVRSQSQKRSQIVLLKEVIRQLRMKFNKKHEKLLKEKEDILLSIDSRNARIKTILTDLRQEEEVETPKLNDVEILGSAIRISDVELMNRPYETEAVKAKRIRDEEERRRKELEDDKEDVKGRALEEMMYGTLEVKRDVFSEASSLVKPEWMEILTPGEMNESQLKEYDAFQLKVKAILEEQNNYRKVLEQEIKKLKTEIYDLCKLFDEKLDDLAKLKIVVDQEILSNEIYISRISMNMAKTEQHWKLLKRTEDQIITLRKERSEIRSRIDQYNVKFEDIKIQIGLLQEEERQMDKSFKRDLQNICNTTFDQDSLKIFTNLFRLRLYPKGANLEGTGLEETSDVDNNQSFSNSRAGSKSKSKENSSSAKNKRSSNQTRSSKHHSSSAHDNTQTKNKSKMKASGRGVSSNNNAMGPMQLAAQELNAVDDPTAAHSDKDPYFLALVKKDLDKKALENQIPFITTLNLENDCPEGFIVDQFTWSKLQELRMARIEKEISVKRLTLQFNEIKQKLEFMDSEEALVVNSINEMKASRDSSLMNLKNLESDLDVMVCLRQGQDEVEKDAVVTDYNSAVLIPGEVIGKYNFRIRELGKEKISILSKIKQFRRKINLIDWEAKHHGLEAAHYEAYFTDLQLFRVTRELQRVIRDGSDVNQAKDRLDKVMLRKEYLTKDAEGKLNNLRMNNDALKRQHIIERNQECSALDNRIEYLRSEVASFQDVKTSRDDARGVEGDPAHVAASKMKKVVSRRNMVDTARAQAEEIDFLRQELDKMRQRTFPSFVRATKRRVAAENF